MHVDLDTGPPEYGILSRRRCTKTPQVPMLTLAIVISIQPSWRFVSPEKVVLLLVLRGTFCAHSHEANVESIDMARPCSAIGAQG